MTQSERKLSDLLALVAAAELSVTRKRDLVSSIRVTARLLGMPPEAIPLDVKFLRRRLEEISPESFGLKRATWRNVRSQFGRALAFGTPVTRSVRRTPMS